MLASLILTAAATLGQPGGLEVSNPRPTFGYLGAAKPSGKGILPGDIAHFTFDVKNLKHDATGKASYSIAIEVKDGSGAVAFQQEPHNAVAQNFFGGNVMPCSAHMEIPLDAKAGVYTWKVTLQDRLGGNSKIVTGKGMILEPDFGLIRVATFADASGKVPMAPVGAVGSTLYVSFAAVGFGRDPKSKQPDLKVKMRILDDKGQPTLAQPLAGHVKSDIPESLKIIPLQFALAMNRPGAFTVELSAHCERCGKDAKVTFPVRVVAME